MTWRGVRHPPQKILKMHNFDADALRAPSPPMSSRPKYILCQKGLMSVVLVLLGCKLTSKGGDLGGVATLEDEESLI